MIPLGPTQALEASATTATTVTYTVSGLLMNTATPPVAQNYEVLTQGQVAASAGVLYEPSSSQSALISSVFLQNTSATLTQTVKLYVKGTTAAHQIATINIPPGGWAQYDSGKGWQVYSSSGIQLANAALAYVSKYITANVTLSATTATNITSVTLAAGTWLIFGAVLYHLTTATLGHADIWLGPNTASKTSAYVSASNAIGDLAGGVETCTLSVETVQTFTAATTVYLEGYSSEAVTARHTSDEDTVVDCTGILAVKIG